VARLEELGARRTDVGQGSDATWVVMSDADGNEFCVLQPLPHWLPVHPSTAIIDGWQRDLVGG
jgi:hypothetical protein